MTTSLGGECSLIYLHGMKCDIATSFGGGAGGGGFANNHGNHEHSWMKFIHHQCQWIIVIVWHRPYWQPVLGFLGFCVFGLTQGVTLGDQLFPMTVFSASFAPPEFFAGWGCSTIVRRKVLEKTDLNCVKNWCIAACSTQSPTRRFHDFSLKRLCVTKRCRATNLVGGKSFLSLSTLKIRRLG